MGEVRLILGDALAVLPTLFKASGGAVRGICSRCGGNAPYTDWTICEDCLHSPIAVVTDPPYGLGDKLKSSGSRGNEWRKHFASAPTWDETTAQGVIELARFPHCIIWGGNYYPLPPARGWLIWDKKQEHSSGHAELAWTNLDQPVRTFRLPRVEAYSRMNKKHPTQKPIELMRWCLSFLPEGCTVLDPFMGSGTTGVACVETGRSFIGIENNPDYFAIAEKRIAAARNAQPLFAEVPG